MKYLNSYKIFESIEGTSFSEIVDILADIIDEQFYVEVNIIEKNIKSGKDIEISVGDTIGRTDIISSDEIGPDKPFEVIIMTNRLIEMDPMDMIDDYQSSDDYFRWIDIEQTVKQMISFLSSKYKFKECRANITPSGGSSMDLSDIDSYNVDNEIFRIDLEKMIGVSKEVTDERSKLDIKIDPEKKYFCNVLFRFDPK